MRDEAYAREEIGEYGRAQSPALARRVRPFVRRVGIGVVAAVVGLVASVVAALLTPGDDATAQLWAKIAIVLAIVLTAICALQFTLWSRALAEWEGRKDARLLVWVTPSWWAHAASYLVAVVLVWAVVTLVVHTTWVPVALVFWLVAGGCLIAGQLLAAVARIEPSGPPGTLPAHVTVEPTQRRDTNR